MQAYVDTEPHVSISTRLDHFCDEATFAGWEQDRPDLPDWQTSWRYLTTDGKAAQLTHPSAQTRPAHCRHQSNRPQAGTDHAPTV
jgi:hypothetical protein